MVFRQDRPPPFQRSVLGGVRQPDGRRGVFEAAEGSAPPPPAPAGSPGGYRSGIQVRRGGGRVPRRWVVGGTHNGRVWGWKVRGVFQGVEGADRVHQGAAQGPPRVVQSRLGSTIVTATAAAARTTTTGGMSFLFTLNFIQIMLP